MGIHRQLNENEVTVWKGGRASNKRFGTYSPLLKEMKNALVIDDGENIIVKRAGMFDCRKENKITSIRGMWSFTKESDIPYGRYQIDTDQSNADKIVIPYNLKP